MVDDLELDWKAVRKVSPIKIVSTRSSDLESQLELACEKTVFDMTQVFAKHALLTKGLIFELMTELVRRFMGHWKQALKEQNLAGLIEIVLEGQKLSPTDLKSFLMALPSNFIVRVCDSAIGGASSGIHAVMGIEQARRLGKATYDVTEICGRFCLECVDLELDAKFQIFLGDRVDEIK